MLGCKVQSTSYRYSKITCKMVKLFIIEIGPVKYTAYVFNDIMKPCLKVEIQNYMKARSFLKISAKPKYKELYYIHGTKQSH